MTSSRYESRSASLIFKEIIYKIISNNCRTEAKGYFTGALSCLRIFATKIIYIFVSAFWSCRKKA